MTNLHARDRSRYRVSILCGLLGVSKQAYYNLIRSFIPSVPNQLWVSDITYIMMTLEGGGHAFNLRQALKTDGQPSTGIKDIGQQL